jgi:hypothetical protein
MTTLSTGHFRRAAGKAGDPEIGAASRRLSPLAER